MNKTLCVVGVAGGSGSGKTTLAQALMDKLGDQALLLYQDSYYIDQSHRFDGDGGSVNFDHPDSLEFLLLAQHLQDLKTEKTIEIPQYDFATHSRQAETQKAFPAKIVIIDGTLLLSQQSIRDQLDVSVFVHTEEKLRYERRLARDVAERGRTPEGVEKQFRLQVKPMHDEFVEPSAQHAQLVLSGERSIESSVAEVLQLLKPFIK